MISSISSLFYNSCSSTKGEMFKHDEEPKKDENINLLKKLMNVNSTHLSELVTVTQFDKKSRSKSKKQKTSPKILGEGLNLYAKDSESNIKKILESSSTSNDNIQSKNTSTVSRTEKRENISISDTAENKSSSSGSIKSENFHCEKYKYCIQNNTIEMRFPNGSNPINTVKTNWQIDHDDQSIQSAVIQETTEPVRKDEKNQLVKFKDYHRTFSGENQTVHAVENRNTLSQNDLVEINKWTENHFETCLRDQNEQGHMGDMVKKLPVIQVNSLNESEDKFEISEIKSQEEQHSITSMIMSSISNRLESSLSSHQEIKNKYQNQNISNTFDLKDLGKLEQERAYIPEHSDVMDSIFDYSIAEQSSLDILEQNCHEEETHIIFAKHTSSDESDFLKAVSNDNKKSKIPVLTIFDEPERRPQSQRRKPSHDSYHSKKSKPPVQIESLMRNDSETSTDETYKEMSSRMKKSKGSAEQRKTFAHDVSLKKLKTTKALSEDKPFRREGSHKVQQEKANKISAIRKRNPKFIKKMSDKTILEKSSSERGNNNQRAQKDVNKNSKPQTENLDRFDGNNVSLNNKKNERMHSTQNIFQVLNSKMKLNTQSKNIAHTLKSELNLAHKKSKILPSQVFHSKSKNFFNGNKILATTSVETICSRKYLREGNRKTSQVSQEKSVLKNKDELALNKNHLGIKSIPKRKQRRKVVQSNDVENLLRNEINKCSKLKTEIMEKIELYKQNIQIINNMNKERESDRPNSPHVSNSDMYEMIRKINIIDEQNLIQSCCISEHSRDQKNQEQPTDELKYNLKDNYNFILEKLNEIKFKTNLASMNKDSSDGINAIIDIAQYEIENKYQETNKNINCLTKHFDKIVDEKQNIVEHCKKLIDTNEECTRKLKEKLAWLEEENTNLSKQNMNLSEQNNKNNSQLENLMLEKRMNDKKTDEIFKLYTDIEMKNSYHSQQVKSFEKSVDMIEKKIKEHKSEIKLKVNETSSQMSLAEDSRKNLERTVKELKLKIKNNQVNIDNLNDKVNEFKQNISKLQSENKSLKAELVKYKYPICLEKSIEKLIKYRSMLNEMMQANDSNEEENIDHEITKDMLQILKNVNEPC